MAHDLAQQLTMARQQIDQRAGMGDRLDVPRPIDHSAEFKRRDRAEAAAEELRTLGYDVTLGKRGLRKVLVEATKHSSVDLETAESFTREVFAVIDRHGGDYDGWGGPVES